MNSKHFEIYSEWKIVQIIRQYHKAEGIQSRCWLVFNFRVTNPTNSCKVSNIKAFSPCVRSHVIAGTHPGYMCIMVIISIVMLLNSRYDQICMDLSQTFFTDTPAFSHSPQPDHLCFLCISFDFTHLSPLEVCSIILTKLFWVSYRLIDTWTIRRFRNNYPPS